jgi:hypothetical protein
MKKMALWVITLFLHPEKEKAAGMRTQSQRVSQWLLICLILADNARDNKNLHLDGHSLASRRSRERRCCRISLRLPAFIGVTIFSQVPWPETHYHLLHYPLSPLNRSGNHLACSRTSLRTAEQIVSCVQMTCDQNPGDDCDDPLAPFVHCGILLSSPFVRHMFCDTLRNHVRTLPTVAEKANRRGIL